MTEEQTNQGVSAEEVADPQGSVKPEPNSQEINWQKANETMAEQKQRLEQLEKSNQTYQQQLAVMQQYMNQGQQQSSAQSAKDDPLSSVGDDDLLTGAEFKRALGSYLQQKEQQIEQKFNQYNSQMSVMQLRAQYPDYMEAAQEALKLAESDPSLAEAIRSSSNPALLAYQLGKSRMQPQVDPRAQKIVENAQKPGSISQASTGSSALSKANYFLNLSDADFEKHIAKIKLGH